MSSTNNTNTDDAAEQQHPKPDFDYDAKKEENNTIRPSFSSQGQQQQQPPKRTAFVHKLYAMLSDPNLSHLIWWSRKDDDGVFALHPGTEFANALTNYFKHGNVSSFVRQLHMYGFHKVFDNDNDNENKESNSNNNSNSDDLVWEFRHSTGNFKKGDEAGLAFIKRRSSNKLVPEDESKNNRLTDTNVFYPQYHYPVPPEGIPNQPHQQASSQQHHLIHHPQPTQEGHLPEQYYLVQQQQQAVFSAGPELQRSQSPNSFTSGYQQIPRNHQYQIQQNRSSFGSPFAQERQFTPPPPLVQQQLPQQQLQANEFDHSHVHNVTNDLIDQQRTMNVKSEYLNNELKTTASDVLRFSENIPKLAAVLQQQGHRYSEGFNSLRQSFNFRADYYKPSPLSAEMDPQHPQHPQGAPTTGAPTTGAPLPPPHPSAIPQHIQNLQHHQQLRNQSIHFWESSGQRQPSVFVDPLNPSPQGSISSSSSSGNRTASISTQQGLATHSNPVYHISPSIKGSSSVPHIHFQANQSRRNESLPSSLPTSSPTSTTSPHFPPRSIPTQQGPAPRSIPNDRGASIPNISHLTSQLRPSVIEVHQHQQPNQSSSTNNPNNTSVSSNSTYNTLYSASSSISSISSRNSYGSINATFQELASSTTSPPQHPTGTTHHYLPHHPHHHPHVKNRQSLQRTPSSPARIKEVTEDEAPTTTSKSKLSVSSLLTTSPGEDGTTGGKESSIGGKRENEHRTEDGRHSLKKAKSVSDFHR